MAWKFNPFSNTFDQTGSSGGGSSYIDGEVATFSALPTSSTTAPLDSAWLVRTATGTWFTGGSKPAGIYIRTATTGTLATDWTYAGTMPDVFSDANFTLYDDADSSKTLKFDLSYVEDGTTVTLTPPNQSGFIQMQDFAASFPSLYVYGSDTGGGQFSDIRLKGKSFIGNAAGTAGVFVEGNETFGPLAAGFTGLNESVTQYRDLYFTAGYFPQIWMQRTTGYVGIQTAYPTCTLDVNGNFAMRDGTNATQAVFNAQERLGDDRQYDLPDNSGTIVLTNADYVADAITPTGYLTLCDSSGTYYMVPAAEI